MRPWLWTTVIVATAAWAGCSGGGKSDGDDTTTVAGDDDDGVTGDDDDGAGDDDDDDDDGYTSLECEVLEDNDLPDVLNLMRDDEHYCESQPKYNPAIPTASAHWYGEMTIDDCGNVVGTENALLFPNDTWSGQGAADCIAVWEVEGVVDAGLNGADYGLDISLVRNYDASDCPEDPFDDDFDGTVHYNVFIDGDTARFYYDGGDEAWAEGYANGSHVSWFFDSCLLL